MRHNHVKEKGNVVECNVCGKINDAAIIGVLKDGEDLHRFAFCNGCVANMKKVCDAKYKVATEEIDTWGAWATATDES